MDVGDVAQQWWRAVELTESTAEDGAGDDAVPLPADEGGAGEGRGVIRWEAEEEQLDEVVNQNRRIRRWRALANPWMRWAQVGLFFSLMS